MPIKYRLRQSARDDLKDIARYTLKHHGKVQRDRYLNGLKERFELLGENPNFGRSRDDVKIGCHCSDYNKHVVFYVIQNDYVEILAILHERMIPERHL